VTAKRPESDLVPEPRWRIATEDEHLRALVVAFESMPITARLRYVSALLNDRIDRDEPRDPVFVAAWDILESVRNDIEDVPNFEQLVFG